MKKEISLADTKKIWIIMIGVMVALLSLSFIIISVTSYKIGPKQGKGFDIKNAHVVVSENSNTYGLDFNDFGVNQVILI